MSSIAHPIAKTDAEGRHYAVSHGLSVVEDAATREMLRRLTYTRMTDLDLITEIEVWTRMQLRYLHDLSQSEIAKRVGISQMHVSRLLRRSLETMREEIEHPRGERAA